MENEISCVGFVHRASRQIIAAGAYAPAATALPVEQGLQAESQGARSSAWLKCLLRLRGVFDFILFPLSDCILQKF